MPDINTPFAPFSNADQDSVRAFRSYCRGRPIILEAIGKDDVAYITISLGAAIGLLTSGAGFAAARTLGGTIRVYVR